jgi:hypothetical protein
MSVEPPKGLAAQYEHDKLVVSARGGATYATGTAIAIAFVVVPIITIPLFVLPFGLNVMWGMLFPFFVGIPAIEIANRYMPGGPLSEVTLTAHELIVTRHRPHKTVVRMSLREITSVESRWKAVTIQGPETVKIDLTGHGFSDVKWFRDRIRDAAEQALADGSVADVPDAIRSVARRREES